ncbi:DUF3861 domain-containing protein [Acinetobacter sp. CFCC 10889]|uniref:DUF3861 domain-containing protein n=1 Tax=Acinetobacter sp. CFCC 10889 TaxID=1775557 RepID=UPI000DCFDB30|nr:DUF3861 domain-containing protein [Acinetobacter sp. CFCC 10889]
MKQHQYQITVEHLADAKGQPSTYSEPLQFKVGNHDDIFRVLQFVENTQLFDPETTKSFTVGLKLFGEVLLENKDLPLFKDFMPEFIQFMKRLKQSQPAEN